MGAKTIASESSFSLVSSGKTATLLTEHFKYADFWSEGTYWSGFGVRRGDDIFVAKGTTLVVDMSPIEVGNVVVDGTLIFESNKNDIHFICNSIAVSSTGALIAGSQYAPF